MKERSYAAPAVVVLMLALTYTGTYLAMVNPEMCFAREVREVEEVGSDPGAKHYYFGYRNGGRWARVLFWPIEYIDRQIRPDAWPAWIGD